MKDNTEAYLDTVNRIEPDVSPLDQDGALASIAISLKRIADSLEVITDLYRVIAPLQASGSSSG